LDSVKDLLIEANNKFTKWEIDKIEKHHKYEQKLEIEFPRVVENPIIEKKIKLPLNIAKSTIENNVEVPLEKKSTNQVPDCLLL